MGPAPACISSRMRKLYHFTSLCIRRPAHQSTPTLPSNLSDMCESPIACCTMANMRKIGALLLSLLTIPALAQSTIKDSLVKHWKTTGDFNIAVARLMPADSYGYKPVPEELTFGQVLIQVGRANLGACANASGIKRPDVS